MLSASTGQVAMAPALLCLITALQTRENLPAVLRAIYPKNRVAVTKC